MSSKSERKRQAIAEAKEELKSLAKTCETFQLECREIPVVFTLKVFPQDEDFPFDVEFLFLQFSLGWKYPFEPLEVELLNRDDFPDALCEHIEEELAHQAKARAGKAAVFSLLRWIDENFEQLMFVVGEDLASDNAAKKTMSLADIQEAIDAVDVGAPGAMEELRRLYALNKEAEENGGHITVHHGNAGEGSSSSSADAPPSTSHLEHIKVHGVPDEVNEQVKVALAQVGIDILVEGAMRLEGVGILDCTKLVLEVVCDRCADHRTMPLTPLRPVKAKCVKCTKQLVAVYAPATMHEHSRLLGTVAVDGCTPLEVLPSEYVASCLNCDGKVLLSAAALGRFHDHNCFSCAAKVIVRMDRATFHHKKPSAAALRAARQQHARAGHAQQGRRIQEEKIGFQPGDELPKRGACKHYKHSYRWLRFPCCGRCFPCDDCHNQHSNHMAVWANKMICGFCSVEQGFSQGKPCRACGKRVAGRNTANKVTMSRKDARKHRGENKTISRKAARQGRIPHH